MRTKILDKTFAHQTHISGPQHSELGVEWDRSIDKENDVVFFTDAYLHYVDRIKAKKKIAWLIEPYVIYDHHYKYVWENQHKFDHVLTFCRDFINFDPHRFLYYNNHCPWVLKEDQKIHPKTKLCSIVASNKRYAPGHILRHQVIERYKDKFNFDIFGSSLGKFVEKKAEMYKDHMYSIAILNCDFDDYLTEIVTDCFATGTVPIYWGTKSISKWFNPDGIIRFEHIDELESILANLSGEDYKKRLPAIEENFKAATKYLTAEDYIYDTYPFLFKV